MNAASNFFLRAFFSSLIAKLLVIKFTESERFLAFFSIYVLLLSDKFKKVILVTLDTIFIYDFDVNKPRYIKIYAKIYRLNTPTLV